VVLLSHVGYLLLLVTGTVYADFFSIVLQSELEQLLMTIDIFDFAAIVGAIHVVPSTPDSVPVMH
jgi:hypothetical protein